MQTQAPEVPLTRQQQLDAACGEGAFVVDLEAMLAACQRCSRFNRKAISLLHPNWLGNATSHLATHAAAPSGTRTLDAFGFGTCSTRLCDAPPAVAALMDYTSRCHGYWLPTVTYSGETFDAALLKDDWRPGDQWGIDHTFKAAVDCFRDKSGRFVFVDGCTVKWRQGNVSASGVVLGVEGIQLQFLRVRPDASGRDGGGGCICVEYDLIDSKLIRTADSQLREGELASEPRELSFTVLVTRLALLGWE
jgi:hypothetical protein